MARRHFGVTADGHDVDQFELTNKNGAVVRCLSYGCRVTNILLPSPSGHSDIVLGFDTIEEYEADDTAQGAFIGRYAGRIKGAFVTIGGRGYRLLENDGGNYLHGSLQKRVFTAEAETAKSVTFKTVSRDGEDGFPGTLRITVKYTLDDDNRFTMEYFAETDADTHINLTNHAYFNLAGAGTIENHLLRIESGSFLETAEDLTPTGRIIDVTGTPFDFRREKAIGRDIDADEINLKYGRGYDHCFLVTRGEPGEMPLAAEACSPDRKRTLKVFTTQPAIQLYTGNFLDGTAKGKGRTFKRRAAFCLETQHCPDSPNHPHFPSTLLARGEKFYESTILEFGF
ncbi:MAG: galactose mutarotase [Synergistaceae bacterium]|jgi:aldose 1-epimerase|nr:galactose mutarotase [Synergistaceae bacterium]